MMSTHRFDNVDAGKTKAFYEIVVMFPCGS